MFAGVGAAVSGTWKARCSDSCPRAVSKSRDSHLLPLLRNTPATAAAVALLRSRSCAVRDLFLKKAEPGYPECVSITTFRWRR